MFLIKIPKNTKHWWLWEKLQCLHIIDGNVNGIVSIESVDAPQKAIPRITLGLTIPLPRYQRMLFQLNVCMNDHSSTIHNSQKGRNIQNTHEGRNG